MKESLLQYLNLQRKKLDSQYKTMLKYNPNISSSLKEKFELKIQKWDDWISCIESDDKKLDKPARVNATVFGVGVSTRLVIEAAQRFHEWRLENPPESDDAFKNKVLNFIDQAQQVAWTGCTIRTCDLLVMSQTR